MKYTDSVSRSFLEYSSPAWRDAYANTPPNKFQDYQDPTYIGFYVRFKGLNQRPVDGNIVGLDEWPGGLFYHEDHPDSAIKYLKNIGEYTRAQMLKEFVSGMLELSQKMPWYFTKVTGLEDIWKIEPGDSFRGKDKKIVFDTLESIDLKMTYLLDLYRKAVFDSVYMRWMLPDNLRVFSMDLVITEIRSFQRPAPVLPATNDPNITEDPEERFKNPIKGGTLGINIPGLGEQAIQNAVSAVVPNSQWASGLSNALISTLQRDPGANSPFPTLMKNFDELATFLVFSFGLCEFDAFSDAPTYFGSLGKTAETVATNKMTIKTPVIREFNTYGLLGAVVEDTLSAAARNESYVDANFWKKTGYNAQAAKTPSSEISYLKGIKGESFNNSQQKLHQNQLKDENTRLGGLLGGLLENVAAVGTAALNNAVSGAIANVLLGNVFSNTFGPTVSAAISKKVSLTAPPFITELLTNVALEGAGIDLVSAISPNTTELVAAPVQEQNVSPVTFASPTLSPIGATTVELQAAPVGSASGTTVELEGALVNGIGATTVDLSGPGAGPILSARVDLTSPPGNPASLSATELLGPPVTEINPGAVTLEEAAQSTGLGGKVTLEGAAPSNTAAGSVKLEGAEPSAVAGGKVTLDAAEASNTAAGSVSLDSPAVNAGSPGKVSLDAAAISDGSPGTVALTAAVVRGAAASSVSLDSPPPSTKGGTKVTLDDNGATFEGSGGKVKLEGSPISPSSLASIELTAAEVSNTKPGTTTLEEPTVKEAGKSRVILESPLINDKIANSVELTSPDTINATPAKVEFTSPTVFDRTLGKEQLEGPIIQNVELGETSLDAAEVSKTALSNVNLKAPTISDDYPGKVFLSSPTPVIAEPGAVELTGPRISTESIGIGNSPQTEPPKSTVAPDTRVPQTGATSQLDINSLGNANLEGPPSSTTPNTTQRSEP